jgi:predicted DNA-binding transcriptional regulator AlpA
MKTGDFKTRHKIVIISINLLVLLAQFLEVSEPTIYAWENKNTWPLCALEKCGFKAVACT